MSSLTITYVEQVPGHDHLLAVRDPALVHLLHENQLVQTLTKKLLQRLLHVVLDQLLQTCVNLKKYFYYLIICS